MLWKRKKKDELHKGDVVLAKGVWLKQPQMNNGNIIMNCFLRSFIVFLLVFGSLGGFLSAFEISYQYVLVMIFYLILSMYFSFLYASSKMLYRDLGYILFFGVFVAAIYVFRLHANSGFYVIVNRVLQEAKSFFELSGVREYETQIHNDYLTVAIVAIFVGMVEIIILNIWIYSTMSLFWTVLLTFPVLLIPLYMKLTPDPLYLIALGAGYAAVVIFKANGHYLAFAWDAPFRIKGFKKNKVTYTQDAGIFRQILVRIVAIGFCVMVLTEAVFPAPLFNGMFQSDRLREKTSESIGNFILLGFESMYNRYPAVGGMSGGKLGGVSNVRPDYQTDLVVSYTPYSNEPVYLKGYTGGRYGDNQWENLYDDKSRLLLPEDAEDTNEDVAVFKEESLKKEAENLQSEEIRGAQYSAKGRMEVKNVGADAAYLYYPYYTVMEDYSIYTNHSILSTVQGLGLNQVADYIYYPKIKWNALGNTKLQDLINENIPFVFLEVPEKNMQVIEQECEVMGLKESMTVNEVVDTVRAYFEENIPYTLKPGATPKGEDFVNYFLTKNRKGYCAHFASAATLIFRKMGIPARYVEGYAFSLENVLASEVAENKEYADYYQGYSELGESVVMDVEVTDAMAHAWVEIYIDGFGWKVVEVTPGSNELAEEEDFWSAFSNFLGNMDENGMDNDAAGGLGSLNLSDYAWLIYVAGAVVLAVMLVDSVVIGRRKLRRYRACHQRNPVEAVIACYAEVCDRVRMDDVRFLACRSHMEQLVFIQREYEIEFETGQICELLERISFSNQSASAEELESLKELIKTIQKALWKKMDMKKRIALCRR